MTLGLGWGSLKYFLEISSVERVAASLGCFSTNTDDPLDKSIRAHK